MTEIVLAFVGGLLIGGVLGMGLTARFIVASMRRNI